MPSGQGSIFCSGGNGGRKESWKEASNDVQCRQAAEGGGEGGIDQNLVGYHRQGRQGLGANRSRKCEGAVLRKKCSGPRLPAGPDSGKGLGDGKEGARGLEMGRCVCFAKR